MTVVLSIRSFLCAVKKNSWNPPAPQLDFLESMADAAAAVTRHFEGRIAFINVMKNMSVDCDCCAVAEDPCIKDIGVLASLAVELVQLVSHRGICDIDDLLENSLGVLIGAVFFLLIRKLRK